MTYRSALLLSFLLTCSVPAASEQIMEVVPRKHRLVSDVLPTMRQLVSPGGSVMGLQDKLIIRTTADNLADLKSVLAALDTRMRQLRITVSQDIKTTSRAREDQLSARFNSGNVSAGVGQASRARDGAQIDIGSAENGIRYDGRVAQRSESSGNNHFVRALEGQAAFINTGQAVPLVQRSVHHNGYGSTVQDTTQLHNVGSGFYVTPRLTGDDGVNLEISPHADNLNARAGTIETRGLSTMVNGRLGEWIGIGGANQSFNDSSNRALGRATKQGNDSYDVWVKVEVVP